MEQTFQIEERSGGGGVEQVVLQLGADRRGTANGSNRDWNNTIFTKLSETQAIGFFLDELTLWCLYLNNDGNLQGTGRSIAGLMDLDALQTNPERSPIALEEAGGWTAKEGG